MREGVGLELRGSASDTFHHNGSQKDSFCVTEQSPTKKKKKNTNRWTPRWALSLSRADSILFSRYYCHCRYYWQQWRCCFAAATGKRREKCHLETHVCDNSMMVVFNYKIITISQSRFKRIPLKIRRNLNGATDMYAKCWWFMRFNEVRLAGF